MVFDEAVMEVGFGRREKKGKKKMVMGVRGCGRGRRGWRCQ